MILFRTFIYNENVIQETEIVFEADERIIHGFLELGRHIGKSPKTGFKPIRACHITTDNIEITVSVVEKQNNAGSVLKSVSNCDIGSISFWIFGTWYLYLCIDLLRIIESKANFIV